VVECRASRVPLVFGMPIGPKRPSPRVVNKFSILPFALHRAGAVLASLVLIAAASLCGCTSRGTPLAKAAPAVNAAGPQSAQRLFVGDTLQLRFANDADLDQDLLVAPSGHVHFPLLGELPVAGKTPGELQEELRRIYAGKLTSAELSVNLVLPENSDAEYSSRRVYVLGEVATPRGIPCLGDPLTIPQALTLAGGHLKSSADLDSVLLVRWVPQEKRYRTWELDARPAQWGSTAQPLLWPQDVLFVPNTLIDKIDIIVDKYIRQLIPFPYLISPL
jgi:polysaccharide biosynthesis/export protein